MLRRQGLEGGEAWCGGDLVRASFTETCAFSPASGPPPSQPSLGPGPRLGARSPTPRLAWLTPTKPSDLEAFADHGVWVGWPQVLRHRGSPRFPILLAPVYLWGDFYFR